MRHPLVVGQARGVGGSPGRSGRPHPRRGAAPSADAAVSSRLSVEPDDGNSHLVAVRAKAHELLEQEPDVPLDPHPRKGGCFEGEHIIIPCSEGVQRRLNRRALLARWRRCEFWVVQNHCYPSPQLIERDRAVPFWRKLLYREECSQESGEVQNDRCEIGWCRNSLIT